MIKRFLKITRYIIITIVILSVIPIVFIAFKLKNDYPLREYIKANYFTSIPNDVNRFITSTGADSLGQIIQEIELIVSDKSIANLNEQIENRIRSIHSGKEFILGTSHWTYVQAKLRLKKDTVDVKLRIRGDFPTNYNRILSESTFRIDIKGDNFFNGKKKISLIRPELENNLYGFMYYKCFEGEDIISNDIGFVRLVFNGKPSGVRFLQEGFSPELIASSNRIPGPILRFKNDCVDNIGRYNPDQFPEMIAYKEKKILKNKAQSKQYARAISKYNALVKQQIDAEQCFDIDAYAKFMALSDIFLSHHAYKCQNVKAYFNPINDKFEPIAWDPSSYVRYGISLPVFPGHNEWFGDYYNRSNEYPIHFVLAKSRTFQIRYISYLQSYIKANKIDIMLNQFSSVVTKMNPILFRQNFQKGFDIKFYKENIQKIKNEFLKNNHLQAKGLINENKLSITSTHAFPIIIDSITYLNQCLKLDTILLPKSNMDLKLYFDSPLLSKYKIKIYSTVLGTDNKAVYLAKLFQSRDNQSRTLFLEHFRFELFDIDSSNMTLSLKNKNITFKESMYIPSGFIWKLEKGTAIVLENNSSIVSESPIIAEGTIDEVITFISNGGGGLLVKNTEKKKSYFSHVIFESLRNLVSDNWTSTGAVTFFKSKVELEACTFNANQSDEALNIIGSSFVLNNTLISNTKLDALGVDFAKGEINNLQIQNTGNDALDFNGTTIKINTVELKNIGGKDIDEIRSFNTVFNIRS